MTRIAVFFLAVACAVCGDLPAQQDSAADPVEKLSRLLDELRRIDPKVWKDRVTALERRIEGHRKSAAELRRKAEEMIKEAAREDVRAKDVRKEIDLQKDMMQLALKLPRTEVPTARMVKPSKGESAPTAPAGAAMARVLNFEEHVAPIFEARCAVCHEEGGADGGLDVTTYEALMRGGGSGPVIKPGDAGASRLYRLVTHVETPKMPKRSGKLADKDLEVIRAWIDGGAAPDAKAAAKIPAREPVAVLEEEAPTTGGDDGVGAMPEGLPRERRDVERSPVVKCLAASPRAPLLAAPGVSEVILYHTDDLRVVGVLPFEPGEVESLVFSRDGERLLAAGGRAGQGGGARLYDVRTGRVVQRFAQRRDSVLAADISPLRTLVALGGPNRRVVVYDVETGEPRYEIGGHEDWVLSIDFSADGNHIASGDRKGRVIVTEADTGRCVHKIDGHTGPVHAVQFRPDAAALATAGEDGMLKLWNVGTGAEIRKARAHDGKALALTWLKPKLLASAGSDGRIKSWKGDGRSDRVLGKLGEWVYALAADLKARRLFTGGFDGRIRIVELDPKAKPAKP